MKVVRVQNIRGEWLRFDHTWAKRKEEAVTFASVREAEDELERGQVGWVGQVMFDVSDV